MSLGQSARGTFSRGLLSIDTVQKLVPLFSCITTDPNWSAQIRISPANLAGSSAIFINKIENALKL